MTNETKNAKKLYKVFANNHGDEPQGTVTKLNISVDTNRVDVFMNVNRKTLTAAYKVFIKAIEQAVADGALDKEVAEFAYFADDIDFAGKDSIEYYDNIDNSFAFGIDDNTDVDNGFYFWFWTKAEDKSEPEQTEINSVEAKEETAMTITTKIAKNGVKMYYLDGKRISRDKAEDIMVNEDDAIIRNANFDTLENFEDAQAVLDIEVVNPIGINELKGWYLSFKTVADAINAASKVPALFGDRFSKAYVMGNAPYHNKVLATVDAAGTVEVNTDEIADVAPAGNAEIHNAQVASGNYSVDINGEFVTFKNHSIVHIDALNKLNASYIKNAKGKSFYNYNREIPAAEIADIYMNRERADEQGKYFHEFFDKYNKASGTIEVWVSLTYADGVDHHFLAEFNQGRLAQKFIADVENLAGDTPCQTFIKYRDNHIKPVWEDPHNFDIVGNLETVRQINYGEEETADVPSDDIEDICKRTPEVDDDKPALLDWDDSAIANNEDFSEKIFTDPAAYDAAIEAAFKAEYPDGCELEPVIIDNGKSAIDYLTAWLKPVKRERERRLTEWNETTRLWQSAGTPYALSAHFETAYRRQNAEYDAIYALETTIERLIDKMKRTAKADKSDTPAFSTKTDKNGKTLYYIDGKRVSRNDYCDKAELVGELPRMSWLNPPEDIDGVITLESGVEGRELVKGIDADSYIDIEGATVHSVEMKIDGRRNRYYINGKRASHDKAIEACGKMRGDNHFTIEYTNQFWQGDEVIARVDRKTMSRLDVKIGMHDEGFSVYFYNGQATIHTFAELEDAVDCVNQIESAYIAGAAGVKVDVDGKVNVDNDISWQMRQVCNDRIHTFDGEWQYIESLTYDAALYKKAYGGHLTWCVDDKDVSEQDFWRAMQQRGACTFDNPLTEAEMLTAKLKDVTRKADYYMTVTTQNGEEIISRFGTVEVHVTGTGFTFATKYETFARYDTKEQCLTVIKMIKEAIERGDDTFTFLTAELCDLARRIYAQALKEFDGYRYIGKGRWQVHQGGRWRIASRKALSERLKTYGVTLAELKEAHHAV